MSNKDSRLSHKYAEEAKIAAATAKLYSKENLQISEDAKQSAAESLEYASQSSTYSDLARQNYEYSASIGQWNLGFYSTPPEKRRDGTSLQPGDFYKNTTDNEVYSYNSDGTWSSYSYDLSRANELYEYSSEMYSYALNQSLVSITYAGDYGYGPLEISSSRQEITYNNLRYYPDPSLEFPFYTTGNDQSSWVIDSNKFIEVGSTSLSAEIESRGTFQSKGNNNSESEPWGLVDTSIKTPQGLELILKSDERGRLKTISKNNGVATGGNLMFPTIENTGLSGYGWPVKLIRFPSHGFEGDEVSPSMWVDYDSSGKPRLFLGNPFLYGNYPYGSSDASLNVNYIELADKNDVNNNTENISSIQPFSTFEIPNNNTAASNKWVLLAQFDHGGDAYYNNHLKFEVTCFGNSSNRLPSLTVTGNPAGTTSDLTASLADYFFSAEVDDANSGVDGGEVCVVQSSSTWDLYVKLPLATARAFCRLISVGYSAGRIIYQNFTTTNSEPSGAFYITPTYARNGFNTAVSSSGCLLSGVGFARLASGNNTSGRNGISSDGFVWSGSGTTKIFGNSVTISKTSTGVYQISGAYIPQGGWTICNGFDGGGNETCAAQVDTYGDSGNQTAVVKVYAIKYTYDSSSGVVTKGTGDLMDIPSDSWVDVQVAQ